MKKKFKDDIVYSTEPNRVVELNETDDTITLAPANQLLKVKLETSGRKGKVVTTISNFIGQDSDLNDLARILKNKCAVGGTVKNKVIEIQGDQKSKLKSVLESMDYRVKLQ
ncbi:MAG: translation initiation factor [Calditrichaeota bacterium]|nr:translation initiation factor [Calditrichota bacterium]